jgi:membrane protease YdiL (CAAX protease family)
LKDIIAYIIIVVIARIFMEGIMNQQLAYEKLSIPKILIMSFVSAGVITLLYITAMRSHLFDGVLPNIAVFSIFGISGLLFTQFGFMLHYAKKAHGSYSIKNILGLRTKLRLREYLIWVPILVFGMAAILMITNPIGAFIQDRLFAWIPDWFLFETDLSGYSSAAVSVTFILILLCTSLIGPITEELFFRGFLLPRMAWLGRWSVLVNAVVFAAYHFWSPWQIIPRILMLLLLVHVVKKKDSLMLGILAHCILNILGDVIIPLLS